jgi:hypothetical protein
MHAGAPVRLRTYPVDMNSVPDCTIVEAVRATFAVPGLFEPVVVTELGGIEVSYSGLGSYNPTGLLLDEVALVFPNGHITCVTSIGAGHTKTAGTPWLGYCQSMRLTYTARSATDCERVEQEMLVRFQDTPGIYFRFCIEKGMQDVGLTDWKKLSKGVVHARSHLATPESGARMAELVRTITTKKRVVPTLELRTCMYHL